MLYHATKSKENMKPIIVKMIRSSILNGLKTSNFNWAATEPGAMETRLFTSSQDKIAALVTASRILTIMKTKSQQEPSNLPSNLNEAERFLDVYLADMSGMEAASFINMRFRPRSNEELLREAQEAINTLKRYGEESKAYAIERIINQRLGR